MSSYRIIAEDCLSFRRRPCQDPETVANLRDRRLRRIVTHAARTVPYYRRAFAEAGLDPRDIRGVQDLHLVAPASREELQGLPVSQRVARTFDPDRLLCHMTSGSTGEPMPVLRTRTEEALVHAYQLRAQLLCGVPLTARRAKVGKLFRPSLVHKLGLLATTEVDATSCAPVSILEELRQWRADCIDVRPGVLEPLVEAAEREGRDDWPWRWIVCGGEVLYPDLLQRAERVFGARVLERYGSHEVGLIAFRCLRCGFLHTNDDSVAVEIQRDGKLAAPGERGEILVTGLLSFALPFLRFPLGDLVVQGPSSGEKSCPFGFGSIGTIEGRQLDNLSLADGRSIPTYNLMAALRQAPGGRRFHVLQKSFQEIHIRYVPDRNEASDLGPELERRLSRALPIPMTVTTERVEQIASTESGKRRYVQSFTAGAPPSCGSHLST